MKKQFFLLCLLGVAFFSFFPHPIYISTTEIDYNKESKSIEIAIKVFSDDMEKALTEIKGMKVEIGTDREHVNATEYIKEYIKKEFSLEVNGKQVELEYVNRKLIRDDFFAMWILFKTPKVHRLKSLKLRNNILCDLHNDQQNFIKFRENKGDRYVRKMTSENNTEVILK